MHLCGAVGAGLVREVGKEMDMSDFSENLIRLMNELADAKECELWECSGTGDEPHSERCLTGNPDD